MEQKAESPPHKESKPFALWVITGGAILAGVFLLGFYLSVPLVSTVGPAYYESLPFFLLFSVLLVVPSIFAWRGKRWAYLTSALVSLVVAILLALFSTSSFSNPADEDFAFNIFLVPTLLLVAGFGILAFRSARIGLRQKPYLASVHSSGGLFTLAIAGFVIGMIVAGAVGAAVILGNMSSIPADIQIVPNAINVSLPYTPNLLTVSVGDKVIWINRDTTAHTVTSSTTGQFDSSIMTTAQTWSHSFVQAGTYNYYCTLHPAMKGTIAVQ